jgi:hypothetical protein
MGPTTALTRRLENIRDAVSTIERRKRILVVNDRRTKWS